MPARRRNSFVEPTTSRDLLEEDDPVRRGSIGGIDCKVVASAGRRNSSGDFRFSMDMEHLLDGSEFLLQAADNVFKDNNTNNNQKAVKTKQPPPPPSPSPSPSPSASKEKRSSPSGGGRRKSRVRRSSCSARVEGEGPSTLLPPDGEGDQAVIEAMQKGIRMAERSSMLADVDDTQDAIRALLQQLTEDDLLDDEDDEDFLDDKHPLEKYYEDDQKSVKSGSSKKKKKKGSSTKKSSPEDSPGSKKRGKSKKKERRASRDSLDMSPKSLDETEKPKTRSRRRASYQDLSERRGSTTKPSGTENGDLLSRSEQHLRRSTLGGGGKTQRRKSSKAALKELKIDSFVDEEEVHTAATMTSSSLD